MLLEKVEKVSLLGDLVPVDYDPMVRALCRRPYYQHPKGCPNFGKRPDCPPMAPLFLNVCQPLVYTAAIRFDFGDYVERRRKEHPDWTEKALRNLRHWQGHVDSVLKRYVSGLLEREDLRGFEAFFTPEAMGVNVTGTCANACIYLEWPPRQYVHKVALLAKRK